MARQRNVILERGYIASIYPGTMPTIRRNVGTAVEANGPRSTTYQLTPVKRGEAPFIMEVADGFELVPDLMGSTTRKKQFTTRLVPYEDLIKNILSEWCENMPNCPHGASPGIMQIAGPVPTPEEMSALMLIQTNFFQWAFNEGERLNRESKHEEIRPYMRDAAKWLGHETVWSNPSLSSNRIPCPFCEQLISATAIVCSHCAKTVRAVPDHLAALQVNTAVLGAAQAAQAPQQQQLRAK